jgi:glycosyltransferase involved in cell wall biosynthesis
MRCCFFCNVPDASTLDRVQYYRDDIALLNELGYEVFTCTRWWELPGNVDLYYVWWWQWGFVPLLRSPGSACIITGVMNYDIGLAKSYVARPSWEKALIRFALGRADANAFLSEFELGQVSTALKTSNPVYVPLGVNTQQYCPGELPRRDFLLTVASMDLGNPARKSLVETIQAMGLIAPDFPELRLVMAGHKGSGYPLLQRLVDEAGLSDRVEFPGAISEAEKIGLMQTCSLYVSPSRFEGFGLAILEAMACGAPIVTSPAGAVPEVVGDSAVMVDGTSPESIAAGIRRYLCDAELAKRNASHARARAQTLFSRERRKSQLSGLIAQVLSRRDRVKQSNL